MRDEYGREVSREEFCEKITEEIERRNRRAAQKARNEDNAINSYIVETKIRMKGKSPIRRNRGGYQ